ncbi:reverse transcriptase (RNA-dependent DNA polymerase) [Hirsutella rhossiliensis]
MSSRPAGSPILFVPKKGGKLRLCVDYRGLNKVTKKNRAALPLISGILDRLGRAKVFTKLDLKDAYHRLRIREGDEWKTAFRCHYGHYEYQVMPFGLVNAPASFQQYINDALEGLVDIICVVYLDDILIFSEDPEQHEGHVKDVLQRLRKAGLYANLSKCEFSVKKVSFLGFVVDEEGIHMEEERVHAITEWPAPRSVKDIQVFLGFTGFYRRFIKNYSKIVSPLTDRLRKGASKPFKLDPKAMRAFEDLKTAFTSFLSRKLQDAETRYAIPDCELLAITEAFRHWRHYLAYTEQKITVLTDHLNHKYFMSKAKLTNRQMNALDQLCSFDFEIVYRPGLKNPADGLSRRPDHEKVMRTAGLRDPPVRDRLSLSPMHMLTGCFPVNPRKGTVCVQDRLSDLASSPVRDRLSPSPSKRLIGCFPACCTSLEDVEDDVSGGGHRCNGINVTRVTARGPASGRDAFVAQQKQLVTVPGSVTAGGLSSEVWSTNDEGLLCYRKKIFVPLGLRNEILVLFHDDEVAGHQGGTKTCKRIQVQYYWPGLRRDQLGALSDSKSRAY